MQTPYHSGRAGSIAFSKQALDIPESQSTIVVFGTLSCLHLYGLILMLLPQKAFGRKKVRPEECIVSPSSHPTPSKKSLCTTCCIPFEFLKRSYKKYFSPAGKLGRRGDDYELRLIIREFIEIPSQTYQAYQMSFRVSHTFFPNFYAAVIILDCLLVPVIMKFGSIGSTIQRRNNILLMDTMVDIALGAVIPLTILLPQVVEYLGDKQSFTDIKFSTNVLSSVKHIVVRDNLDLFISSIPLISSHLLMKTLHNNWRDVVQKNHIDKEELKTLRRLSSNKVVQRKRGWRFILDLIFGTTSTLWGIAILVTIIQTASTNSCESDIAMDYCVLKVQPWLAPSDTCHYLFLRIRCLRPSGFLYGTLNDNEKVYNLMEDSFANDFAPVIMTLALNDCPITQIPPGVGRFKESLLLLSLAKLTSLKSFDLQVDEYQSLLMLYIAEGMLSSVPNTLQSLPPAMFYLALPFNTIPTLPHWIGESWATLNFLMLDHNTLSSLPSSYYNLTNLNEINLRDNSLVRISPSIKNMKSLKTLNLAGNLLTTLPVEIDSLPLTHVNVASNLLTSLTDLPWNTSVITKWNELRALNAADTKLTLAHNSVCLVEEIRNSEACVEDCAPLCDVRERNQRFCSINCNTAACNFHDGKCLDEEINKQQ